MRTACGTPPVPKPHRSPVEPPWPDVIAARLAEGDQAAIIIEVDPSFDEPLISTALGERVRDVRPGTFGCSVLFWGALDLVLETPGGGPRRFVVDGALIALPQIKPGTTADVILPAPPSFLRVVVDNSRK